jgi:hypothetical protein
VQPDTKLLLVFVLCAACVTTIVVVGICHGKDGVMAGSGIGAILGAGGYLARYYQQKHKERSSHGAKPNAD